MYKLKFQNITNVSFLQITTRKGINNKIIDPIRLLLVIVCLRLHSFKI